MELSSYFDAMSKAKKEYTRSLEPVCRDFGLTVRAAVEHPCDSFGGFVGLKVVECHVLVHDVPALEKSQILCKDGAVGIEFLVWKSVRYVADGAFS